MESEKGGEEYGLQQIKAANTAQTTNVTSQHHAHCYASCLSPVQVMFLFYIPHENLKTYTHQILII
jgi:hypothetical protein